MKYLPEYLAANWSIIPVDDNKRPTISSWKRYQYTRATQAEINAWLDAGFGLALVTGKISGVMVVDDDRVKHGLNEYGFSSPIVSTTKSGGKHYYFKYEDGLFNTTNESLHVDIRAEGGYVVIPPTNGYVWSSEPTIENLNALLPLDEKTKKLLLTERKVGEKVQLSELLQVQEGGRNAGLLKMANSLCNRTAKGDWEQFVLPVLFGINQTYNPPLPEHEVMAVFNQATKFVTANPKGVESIPSLVTELVDERIVEREFERNAPRTGFPALDDLINGFVPGHVYTLTGHTNVGKSALAANFAYNVSRQNKKVLYLALEPDSTILDYFASIYHDKKFSQLTDEDLRVDLGQIYFSGRDEISTLGKLTSLLEAQGNLYELIVIDHISYFISGSSNTIQEQSNAMKQMVRLAKQHKTAILLIQHPRKAAVANNGTLDEFSISGSAAFFQDATDVLVVTRNFDVDDETNVMTYLDTGLIQVRKAKSGMNGACPIQFTNGSAIITPIGGGAYEF